MGNLSNSKFNRQRIPQTFIIIGGNTPIDVENQIVKDYQVTNRVEKIFHYYELAHNSQNIGLVFGVYGAPMIIDLIHYLKDGGCTNIIFIGYAYSRNNDWLNKLVVVKEALSVDGISGDIHNPTTYHPTPQLQHQVQELLTRQNIDFLEDNVSSGPSVFYKPPEARSRMHEYTHVIEMEVASVFFASQMLAISSAALVLVNETQEVQIHHQSGAKEKHLPAIAKCLIDYYSSHA